MIININKRDFEVCSKCNGYQVVDIFIPAFLEKQIKICDCNLESK